MMRKRREAMQAIVAHQRRWACDREIDLHEDVHTRSLEANLFRPLDPETRAEIAARRPSPLPSDGSDKPSAMHRLHATEPLCCNLFDDWRARDFDPLARALEAPGTPARMALAWTGTSTALPMPEPDLLLEGEGRPTAVLVSYAEPFCDATLAESAAPRTEDPAQWPQLPGCRDLSRELRTTPDRFALLPAARLLEQARRLTARYGPRGFRLLHLWHDVGGELGDTQRAETDGFRVRAGGEVDFASLTLRELLERLREASRNPNPSGDVPPSEAIGMRWLDYVSDRYLTGPRCDANDP